MNTEDSLTLPFQVGDLIANKYRMDALLGVGGMGMVLAATHLDLDRKVAVKVIRPELAADEGLVERLLLEARAAARIKSEHVGKVLDVGRLDDGIPYIVMELLEGQDLGALLERKGTLSIIHAVDLILQACEAVAEAHLAQIVHRDLKPENLFVTTTADGTACVKVLDFGISKQLDDTTRRALTNPTTAIGSPQYMAPEQMKAEAIDTRVDVWALGAILYEALSGRKAFDASTLPAVCAQVLGADPPPLSQVAANIPTSLEAVVQRCLQKDPQQRYFNIENLAQALSPFGSSRATLSYRRIRALASGKVSTARLLSDAEAAPESESLSSHPAHAAATIKGISRTVSGRALAMSAQTAHEGPTGRPSLWPVFAGASFALVAAVFFWFWARTGPSESALSAAAAASANALPGANVATARTASEPAQAPLSASPDTAMTSAAGATVAASATLDPTPLASAAASSSAAAVTLPPRVLRTNPGRPGQSVSRPQPADSANSVNNKAWDPDNFGGRH